MARGDEAFFPGYADVPCAKSLGWTFVSSDPAAGTIALAFEPDATMLNPGRAVQGGFVAAMLDEAMGGAFVASTKGIEAVLTLTMTVSYQAPVMPGHVLATGRVMHRTRSTAFLEAELHDGDGAVLARATSTAKIVTIPR